MDFGSTVLVGEGRWIDGVVVVRTMLKLKGELALVTPGSSTPGEGVRAGSGG